MRVLIPLAVLVTAMPSAAGIVVLKNGKTFIGKLDAKVLPPCPENSADMPEKIVISWPHNGKEGPEGRSTWNLKGHEVRWYDLESDAPTTAYWEKFEGAKIDDRWHAARERYRQAHGEKPVELVPTPKVELWKGLEKRPLPHASMAINPPQGWEAKDAPSSELPDEEPKALTLRPTEKSKGAIWSDSPGPSLTLWREAALDVGEDLDPWVAKQAATMAKVREQEVVGSAKVRRNTKGLVLSFTSAQDSEAGKIVTLWRVTLRDAGTYCVTFAASEADMKKHEELARRCLSTFKVQERE